MGMMYQGYSRICVRYWWTRCRCRGVEPNYISLSIPLLLVPFGGGVKFKFIVIPAFLKCFLIWWYGFVEGSFIR